MILPDPVVEVSAGEAHTLAVSGEWHARAQGRRGLAMLYRRRAVSLQTCRGRHAALQSREHIRRGGCRRRGSPRRIALRGGIV